MAKSAAKKKKVAAAAGGKKGGGGGKKNGAADEKKKKKTKKIFAYDGKTVVVTATLADIKKAEKGKGEIDSKNLVRVPSKAVRVKLYEEAAAAISAREGAALPSHGGRPWKCDVRLVEQGDKGSSGGGKGDGGSGVNKNKTKSKKKKHGALFRWYRGRLELAVVPHYLEKIEEVDAGIGPRKRHRDDPSDSEESDEEDVLYPHIPATKLEMREVSALSSVAWEDPDHYVPTIRRTWRSPDLKTFHTRKSAMDHAKVLVKRDKLIDKVLHGFGGHGLMCRPVKPTKAKALEAGYYRFLRDGIWVVGQEEDWLEEALEVWKVRENNRGKRKEREEAKARAEMETEALELYIENNKADIQKVEAKKSVFDIEIANRETDVDIDMASSDQEKEKKKTEEGDTTASAPPTQQDTYTESDAITELKMQWEHLDAKEKDIWRAKVIEKQKADEQAEAEAKAAKRAAETEEEFETPEDHAADDLAAEELRPEPKKQKTGAAAASATSPNAVENLPEGSVAASGDDTVMASLTVATLVEASAAQLPTTTTTTSSFAAAAATQEAKPTRVTPTESLGSSSNEGKAAHGTRDDIMAEAAAIAAKQKDASSSTSAIAVAKPVVFRKAPKIARSTHWRMTQDQIDLCYTAVVEHYEKVMHTVKARNLFFELSDGFDVMRERGRGRYDVTIAALDEPKFSFLTDLSKAAWMPIVRKILGDEVVLAHKGAFVSLPGADTQVYHQDGVHLHKSVHKPCYAINVFIPLVDLHEDNGPTEFCVGTHHLGYESFARDMTDTPCPKAGTPIIFDYRTGHRGLGNSSPDIRPIVYLTYTPASSSFKDTVNFSSTRYKKLGELLDKPLSRRERALKREREPEPEPEKLTEG